MDFKILGSIGGLSPEKIAPKLVDDNVAGPQSFSDMVQKAAGQVVEAQKEAASLSVAAANGEDIPLQEVIQAVGKAELMLETMVSVRDKAVEAYQQVQQMPI